MQWRNYTLHIIYVSIILLSLLSYSVVGAQVDTDQFDPRDDSHITESDPRASGNGGDWRHLDRNITLNLRSNRTRTTEKPVEITFEATNQVSSAGQMRVSLDLLLPPGLSTRGLYAKTFILDRGESNSDSTVILMEEYGNHTIVGGASFDFTNSSYGESLSVEISVTRVEPTATPTPAPTPTDTVSPDPNVSESTPDRTNGTSNGENRFDFPRFLLTLGLVAGVLWQIRLLSSAGDWFEVKSDYLWQVIGLTVSLSGIGDVRAILGSVVLIALGGLLNVVLFGLRWIVSGSEQGDVQ